MPDERTPNPGAGGIGGAVAGAVGGVPGAIVAAKVTKEVVPGADTLDALQDAAAAVRRWVSDRHNWVRVAWFAAGVVCFAVGAGMVASRPATTAATTVLPAGKAVKLAAGALK